MESVMKTVVISGAAMIIQDSDVSFVRSLRRLSMALFVSAITAILTGVTGLILAAASLLHFISPYGGLGIIGTILLVVTFPLLIFQAHCLDKIEDTNRAQRMASYKRRVLSDSDTNKPDWHS
jgi:hypothetical protein